MENKIIVTKQDYLDEEGNSRLKFDYSNTHFSTYDTWRDYLHIQVNGYQGLNFYLEINRYEMDRLIKLLQEKREQMY